MMKVLATAIPLLMLMCACTHATADTFGTGANRFAMEFVEIGDPGNPPDTTGCSEAFSSCAAPEPPAGSVDYIYRIGKFEVSRDMVEKANAEGGLGIFVSTRRLRPELPATGVSWNEAARFVNWLNTSQGFPAAYKFTVQPGDIDYDALLRAPFGLASGNIELWAEGDAGFDAANFFRNSQARYFLPSVHEWYKAGYYDPATGGYWDYPTGSNTPPVAVAGGTDPNTAVYGHEFEQGPADITQAGGLSPYGVMGLGGNAGEWEETTVDLRNDDGSRFSSRGMRESAWNTSQISFWPRRRNSAPPDFGSSLLGLRVASAFVERGLLGDFNGDDVVDTVDFQIMADNFNSEGEFSNGDINFNGFVDMADFLEFRAIFAQTPQAASVPEPAFGFISLLASCVLFCVARRHRSL